MSKKKIWYSKLPPAELEKLAAGLSGPVDPARMKPLTATQQREESRARRKAGRPRVGAGAEKLRVSMERTLLKRVDAYARKKGVSRSELIAESLKRTIGAA
ncbi:type II toxin-antitoxin system HicB family antitoxin [Humisphaera borealis]|uniref:Ribbon-helix-helix protein, CopG family n=1 Tax=Humisphaera borealis TaxID=2807512 RepID=A0A7M2WUF5_9BACT|nr:ribbon-helix-helix protein, CopG family [Humisphaera borealis]QOV88802.1 ribbon-helix-helix protein, CopG family [Humisphaera borealis]